MTTWWEDALLAAGLVTAVLIWADELKVLL